MSRKFVTTNKGGVMPEKLQVKIELDRKAISLINTIAQYQNKSPDEIICKIIKDYFKEEQSADEIICKIIKDYFKEEQSAKSKTPKTKEPKS